MNFLTAITLLVSLTQTSPKMNQFDFQLCFYVLFLSLPEPADPKAIIERHKTTFDNRPSVGGFKATSSQSNSRYKWGLGSSETSNEPAASLSLSQPNFSNYNLDYWMQEGTNFQEHRQNGGRTPAIGPLDVDTESDLFKQQSKEMFDNLQYDNLANSHQTKQKQQMLLPLPGIPHGPTKSYFDYPTSFWRSQTDDLASLGLEDIEPRSDNMLNQLSGESLAILGQIKSVNKESCKAKMFNQTIMLPGCEPKVIKNRFCYGRCNSFYVPLDETQNQFRFKTCSACKPIKSAIIEVRLKCLSSELKPTKRKVRVEKIESCRCVAESVTQKQSQFFRNV